MEKFRPILGKIPTYTRKNPRNFSMLTPRIFCFTEDGSSEELTKEKFLGMFIPWNFSSVVPCPDRAICVEGGNSFYNLKVFH
jgi:hypothetical protein